MAPSLELSLCQYNYVDISLEFRIDDLHDFLKPGGRISSRSHITSSFGPGWFIKCWPTRTSDEDEVSISCGLYVGPMGYPRPIFCSFVGRSATSGFCYFEHSATYVFGPNQMDNVSRPTVCQESPVLTKRRSYRFRRLQEEQTLIITANIRTLPEITAQANCTVPLMGAVMANDHDLVYSLINAEELCKCRFVAFQSRNHKGSLNHALVFPCGKDVLLTKCPELHKCESSRVKADQRCGLMLAPGMNNQDNQSCTSVSHMFRKHDAYDASPSSSFHAQLGELDYDSDSDFEEDDDQEQSPRAGEPRSLHEIITGEPSTTSNLPKAEEIRMAASFPTSDTTVTMAQGTAMRVDEQKSDASAKASKLRSSSHVASESVVTQKAFSHGK